MTVRIPLANPEITDADRACVMDVLRTPYLSMGPKLRKFEEAICEYTGSKYAVAVNSGTSALHLAVRALELERGAEVIVPSFTFSALLNVILQEGLQPKFVDIDPSTYNATPDLIADAISPRTRLILAVHTFGSPVDVRALLEVAQDSSRARPRSTSLRAGPHRMIHVIEDACEALGAEVHGRKVGTIGEAGLFAFYPNKQITTGEGGMLVTSNQQVAAAAERLRNQGRDPALGLNQHVEVGYSYRISDINCALGISQLSRIEAVIARRQRLAEIYDFALTKVGGIIRPSLTSAVGKISWFVYPIQLSADFNAKHRDWICESLLSKGIATGRYFAPLHRQPVLRSHPSSKSGEEAGTRRLQKTEAVADRVIELPFFNELTELEIQEVAGALEESIRELRRKM
jgi:perosamine synthetase